jgi:hypothetical protein
MYSPLDSNRSHLCDMIEWFNTRRHPLIGNGTVTRDDAIKQGFAATQRPVINEDAVFYAVREEAI